MEPTSASLNELQSDFHHLTSKEQSLQKISREIALYNLILSSDFIDEQLLFATVKVFRDVRKFLSTYPAQSLSDTTFRDFGENSQIFVIDVHMSKSIENAISKHNWHMNITIKSGNRIFAQTSRLKPNSCNYVMVVDNGNRFENVIKLYLLLDKEKNTLFHIHLKIKEMTTNIFNYLQIVDLNSREDVNKLKSFCLETGTNVAEIYELCLKQFYYNLSPEKLAMYVDMDAVKWPSTIFGFLLQPDNSVFMEFKFRKNTVTFHANPKTLKAIKDFLVDSYAQIDKYASLSIISNVRDLCLIDVLDQARLLEEIRSNNSKLLEFLIDDKRMEEMIELLINEPPFVYREEDRYKYAYLACEVLSSGNLQLKKRIIYDDSLLQMMYSLIEREAPINYLSATFVVQVASSFFSKNSDVDFVTSALDILRIIEFLQMKKTFVQLLLRHLENSSIKNGIIRLLTADIGDSPRSRINELFENEDFLPSIIALLGPEHSSVIHFNVGEVLCKIISKLRAMKFYSDKNPDYFHFLNALGSPETIDLILQTVLVEPIVESSVNNGIRVILALLEYPKMILQNEDRNALLSVIGQTVCCLKSHMHAFHKIIVDPPQQLSIRTTTGLLDPPFGKLRHSVTALIKEAIMTRNVDFILVIVELKTLDVLLNLFFHYKWNNFLHKFVEDCFMTVLNVALNDCNRDLCDLILTHVFIECDLMKRLLNTWIENNNNIEKKSSLIIKKFGYIGHVVNLCNYIEKLKSSYDHANTFISENINEDFRNEWKNFVNGPINTVLNNRKKFLGGIDLDLPTSEDTYYEKSENNKLLSKNEMSEFVNDMNMENKSENLDNRFNRKMDSLDDEINEDTFVKKMKEASLISSAKKSGMFPINLISEKKKIDSWGFCDDNSNANWADFENADFSVTYEYSSKNELVTSTSTSTSPSSIVNKEPNFIRKVSSIDNLSLAEYFHDNANQDIDFGDDQVFHDDEEEEEEDSEETDDEVGNVVAVTAAVATGIDLNDHDDAGDADDDEVHEDDDDSDDDNQNLNSPYKKKAHGKVPFVIRSILDNIISQIEYQEMFL